MKRPTIAVTITDTATGVVVHTETRSAWNAAIRASEAAIRAIACSEGQLYSGGRPDRWITGHYPGAVGDNYVRTWTGDTTGAVRTATIEIVSVPE